MTAYWINPKPQGVRDYSEIPYLETDKSSRWYLHGELQGITGSDKALVTNVKSGGFSKDTIDWAEINGTSVISVNADRLVPVMCIYGKIPVEIEGIPRECLGYFWVDNIKTIYWKNQPYSYWEQRGVVVSKDNQEDIKYAEKLLKERPKIF